MVSPVIKTPKPVMQPMPRPTQAKQAMSGWNKLLAETKDEDEDRRVILFASNILQNKAEIGLPITTGCLKRAIQEAINHTRK